jgi:hypothetical protein
MRSFPERERQKNSYNFIRKFIFDAKGGKEEAVETIKVDILLSLSLCAFCVYVCSWFFSTPASRSFNYNARRKKEKNREKENFRFAEMSANDDEYDPKEDRKRPSQALKVFNRFFFFLETEKKRGFSVACVRIYTAASHTNSFSQCYPAQTEQKKPNSRSSLCMCTYISYHFKKKKKIIIKIERNILRFTERSGPETNRLDGGGGFSF